MRADPAREDAALRPGIAALGLAGAVLFGACDGVIAHERFVVDDDSAGESGGAPAEALAAAAKTRPPLSLDPFDAEAFFAGLPGGERPTLQGAQQHALAMYFRTLVFPEPDESKKPIGFLRRGARVPVTREVQGRGCSKGSWYELGPGAYVCTARGARVGENPAMPLQYSLPDTQGLLPYAYAKVMRPEAERFYRAPRPDEWQPLATEAPSDLLETRMKGIYLLAIADADDESPGFLRTVRGRAVWAGDTALKPLPAMYGERLSGKADLPLAFVYRDRAPIYRRQGGQLEKVGSADKHARFKVVGSSKDGDRELVEGPAGALVDAENVRVIRSIERPEKIEASARWIHVDLSTQTLVAYEGDAPVFATVVSSGQPGFEPPLGTFEIVKKYVTTTMSGPDPDAGYYEVEEVPWTMYYWGSFALHGAYWHNDFGRSRSHGCTNLAPADARWLYHWTTPEVPSGWHARIDSGGTHVHFTNGIGDATE